MQDRPELSIVIPIYNSADIFPELYLRLTRVLKESVRSYEIIAVVDGCKDQSSEVVASFCEQDPAVKLIELSRNFGEQAATTAGLEFARGEMVVVMDDDLEDPPEVIPQFLAKARDGFDVVYGIMRKRKTSAHRRFFYTIFYRFLNLMTDIHMPRDAGSFSLVNRRVLDELNALPERNRYVRGLRTWVGFNQTGLEYEREDRFSGRSGYSFRSYFQFAVDAILSFSYKPLHWFTVIGLLICFASFAYGLRIVSMRFLDLTPEVPGWTSLMVIVVFFGGVNMLALGIIGQYIARVYDESKRRPVYVVKRSLGF